jgi:hypothetical protein
MTRILSAVAIGIAVFAGEPRPAQASGNAPWCLVGQGGSNGRCYYNSIEACIQEQAGGGVFCNPNPAYRGEPQSARPKAKRRR